MKPSETILRWLFSSSSKTLKSPFMRLSERKLDSLSTRFHFHQTEKALLSLLDTPTLIKSASLLRELLSILFITVSLLSMLMAMLLILLKKNNIKLLMNKFLPHLHLKDLEFLVSLIKTSQLRISRLSSKKTISSSLRKTVRQLSSVDLLFSLFLPYKTNFAQRSLRLLRWPREETSKFA